MKPSTSLLSLLVVSSLFITGCSTPPSIKTGSSSWAAATRDLGEQYKSDLADLRERLDAANTERTTLLTALAESKASRQLLVNSVVANHGALKFAQALNEYDVAAAQLLDVGFEEAFEKTYMTRVRGALQKAADAKAEAERQAIADPSNAGKMKDLGLAASRLFVLQRQVLEDYRRLRLQLAAELTANRSSLIQQFQAKLPAESGNAGSDGFPERLAGMVSPNLTTPVPNTVNLTTGLAEREAEITAYSASLNALASEVDHYIQTDGWRQELLKAFLQEISGQVSSILTPKIESLQQDTADFIKDKVGIPELAKEVEKMDLKSVLNAQLDKIALKATQALERGANQMEEKVQQTLGPEA